MTPPLAAILALPRPWTIDLAAVAATTKGIQIKEEIKSDRGVIFTGKLKQSFSIMSHAVPLPLDQLIYGPGPNPFWADPVRDLSPHTAHVRVVSLTEPKDRVELVIAYRELMNTVSGIANIAKAIGVLWCPADNLLPAQTFISMRDFVLQTNLAAAEIYARLVFARHGDKVAVATHGLRPLIGREIEFTPIRPQDLDPEAMYDRVFQIAKYLIACATNDPPRFKHGDRVGPEKFRVDLADMGAIAKEPVYLIVTSDSAVEV